jgi:hypothetical protein
MAVDTLSRRALLEMKRDNDYAPRYRVWPPEGYTAPTAEEFADLLRRAKGYRTSPAFRSQWERLDDATVLRRAQLCELASTVFSGQDKGFVYDYARALRAEMNRRKIVFRSIAILRCQSCSHATERLFAKPSDLPNRKDAAFYCARCWSGYTLGDLADGLADEDDEAEDEG